MLLSLCVLAVQTSPIRFEVKSGEGLQVWLNDVPIVRGSWFQYYEPDWSKGYYSSSTQTQKVVKQPDGSFLVTFESKDKQAHGTQVYKLVGDTLSVDSTFEWDGASPVKVEASAGMIWAPAFASGDLYVNGNPVRSLRSVDYRDSSLEKRKYGEDSTNFLLRSPVGEIILSSDEYMTLFDSRNGYGQDWAEGKQLFWAGCLGLSVAKGSPAKQHVDWKLAPSQVNNKLSAIPKWIPTSVSKAITADERLPLLLPKPQKNLLNFAKPTQLHWNFRFPAGRPRQFEDFKSAVERRFSIPVGAKPAGAVAFDGGVSKLGLTPGGYRITIGEGEISVYGEEEEGVRNGLQRLAQLVFAKDGKLWLPTGSIIDQPKIAWRGVHLFVGQKALPFQKRLWERVLLPLGFNKVVLQCEQTNWNCLPGIGTSITMDRQDLAKLFDMYRSMGVEPIPLIQSFGHAEWLFANGKNLDVAYNPSELYAMDPRKPRTQEVLNSLWDEAITLLKPQTIHFGLDEVDMRGFDKDPKLVTALWKQLLPFLAGIAKRHEVQMMLWGDKALGPGEAIDAALGDTKEDAAERRSVIPKGSFIGDWHYTPELEPRKFEKSLQIWRDAGMKPIASTWSRPENIRGFGQAAFIESAGLLQTTWAGYESSEANMIKNLSQFTAMVLAADYSWSARTELPSSLEYDPAEVFRRMYFSSPSQLTPKSGVGFATQGAVETQFGPLNGWIGQPISLTSKILPSDGTVGDQADLLISGKASSLVIVADTAVSGDDGEQAAKLVVQLVDGKEVTVPLIYGLQVRSPQDSGICLYAERDSGTCAYRYDFGGMVDIKSAKIVASSPVTGLRLYGITLVK